MLKFVIVMGLVVSVTPHNLSVPSTDLFPGMGCYRTIVLCGLPKWICTSDELILRTGVDTRSSNGSRRRCRSNRCRSHWKWPKSERAGKEIDHSRVGSNLATASWNASLKRSQTAHNKYLHIAELYYTARRYFWRVDLLIRYSVSSATAFNTDP